MIELTMNKNWTLSLKLTRMPSGVSIIKWLSHLKLFDDANLKSLLNAKQTNGINSIKSLTITLLKIYRYER